MTVTQDELYQHTSEEYVGKWNRLISTTNWEKGRIIYQWRVELIAQKAPATEYSDETWAQRVGGVSSQHVGRLRRVHERFEEVREQYDGLYWSHFQAAIEWEDAEMWLEGAVQNQWSVSQMKNQRWEALGAPAELKPSDEDIVVGQLDEDVDPAIDAPPTGTIEPSVAVVQDPGGDAPSDEAEEDSAESHPSVASQTDVVEPESPTRVRPFERLPELPDDLADALEDFKLAIVRHKMAGWQEVSRDHVLMALDALKELALAPSEE